MPALNDVLAESQAQSVKIQQIIGALTGVSNQGIPIALTSLNDPTNYALTVQNGDPTNSRALKVLKADGSNLITADANGVTLGSPLVLPTGSITSAMILDGTIQNVDLAAGTAAANVGTLGGVLSGTLPNPGMAAGAAFANLGAHGVSNFQTTPFGAAISTSSASFVVNGDSLTYTPNAGSNVFAVYFGSFANATAGAINSMYLGFNATQLLQAISWHQPVANYGVAIVLFGLQQAVSGAPIVIQPYWQVNAGTINQAANRQTIVLELKR